MVIDAWDGTWVVWVILGVISTAHIAVSPVKGAKGTRVNRLYPPVAQVVCPPGCATCSSMNGCVTCEKGLFLFLHRDGMLQTGICVHACPTGYYGLRLTRDYRRCQRCTLMHCESCYSLSYCTRCSPPYRAYQGSCSDQCPPDTYFSSYTQQCVSQVDCAVGAWSAWGLCTRNGKTCGYKYGVQQRTRLVLQQPSANGYGCPDTADYQECRLQYRTCQDLINNESEPEQNAFLDSLLEKWRRDRERRRRRRKSRGKRKKKPRGKKKDKDAQQQQQQQQQQQKQQQQQQQQQQQKQQQPQQPRKNKKHQNKKRTNSRRKQKQQRPLLPDVTTNQINVLLDADDMKKM